MCGFVGVYQAREGESVNAETLRSLLHWVRHRGPDQEGVYVDDRFGVASARLAVRGGDDGDQPLVSDDGSLVVVFNGELHGRPADEADSRALLDRHGADVVNLLSRSMGAFAQYDRRTHDLVLGTDRLGIKPLFFDHRSGALWFASELKPLIRDSATLSLEGLAELLHFQRPRKMLPFERVSRLRGTIMPVFGAGRLIASVFDPVRDVVLGDEPERVRRAVADAARHAADVDGPVSLFLSGGLDSSAVAAFCGRDDVLCLTGRFEPHAGPLDESNLAVHSAAHLGMPHEVVDLKDEDLLLDLRDVTAALEVPMMGPGSLAMWRMAMRAREHGKVVLTGTGGDELFGGYARTALALGRAGVWTKGYEPLRAKIEAAGSDPDERLRACFSRFADLEPVLDRDFLRTLPDPTPITRTDSADPLVDALLREERAGALAGLLDVEDRVTSAHGLEGRPVLCLGDVPEVATSITDKWLIGPDGEGKRVLREALRGHIPEHVRTNRVKRGFPTPFARAARGAGREIAMEILHDQRFAERGWWNVDACLSLMDEERPLHDRSLWAVLSWETWARLFLDGDLFKESA